MLVYVSPARATPTGRNFDHIVTIVMENTGLADICGLSSPPCDGSSFGTQYMASLANSNSLALHYLSIGHPSMINYLALFSGQTWGCTDDVDPNSGGCTTAIWNSQASNLADYLDSVSVTWKAYMENMTSNCQTTDVQTYVQRHDPFVYFNDIVGNPSRCAQVVPAGTSGQLDNTLLSDLGSTSAPGFMWLTPNLCDDMHDICTGTNNQISTGTCTSAQEAQCLPVGNNYLANLVPNILNSYTFTNSNSALFITFDEGNGFCTNGNSNDDCLYTVFAGTSVKTGYTSTQTYDHYSYLATLENNWSFNCIVAGNDCSANNMSEFFVGTPTFTLTPTIWSCTLINGCQMPFTVTSQYGFSGTVSFRAVFLPSGDVASFTPSTVSLTNGSHGTTSMMITGPCVGSARPAVWASSGSITQTSNGHFVCVQ